MLDTRSSHVYAGNADFLDSLYQQFLRDPLSVDEKWRAFFESLKNGGGQDREPTQSEIREYFRERRPGESTTHTVQGMHSLEMARKQSAVLRMIHAYRLMGHLRATVDPIQLRGKPKIPELDPVYHGLTDNDQDLVFNTGGLGGRYEMPLREIIDMLKETYTESIGSEFMHIPDVEQKEWIQHQLELTRTNPDYPSDFKVKLLERLTAAEGLETHIHHKYVGQKRFSLEGGETLITMLDEIINRGGTQGVREVVIGMAHRGRLNVLINTLGKPSHKLFAEFEGQHDGPHDPAHSGDVKYHMGFSSDVITPDGPVHLALGFNPSHLEIIDPVIAGSVRARQTRRGDAERRQVLPLLIHGDAAFAGQGVVMELLQMSQARGFAVGGTVHVVINNQVGFTTSRTDDARSTLYCTDVAKMVGAPILHVNGDDPEAVLFCARLAFDFRQRFHRDVVIDLVCYRRHGHNEADEPAATQPLMYQHIRRHKTPRELYAGKLEQAGVVGADEAKAMVDRYRDHMDAGEGVVELAADPKDDFAVDWSPYLDGQLGDAVDTAVKADTLKSLADTIISVPEDVKLHARVARIYEDRARMAAGEIPMDWGFAENLAYATLIAEGSKLRLVGQDSGRGTFFHRHAVLHDQKTGATDMPLRRLARRPEDVTIIDSLLSEEAVMGFEYGYATADPTTLNIWEGQFGDFANGAQVVIDQFISSGEAKWGRLCGLALFLPHGYEGQGPEHSSARLERFLQLCALDNMQVCMPTTPAQMFHMIRRQMLYRIRKPLIVMMPKSMLRNKRSVSSLAELSRGGFQNLIPDSTSKAGKPVRRVVACAGKVYYDLLEEAEKREITDVAIVRVEQLYPFPRPALIEELQRFPAAKELVWCQEEPMNQGAWYQIQHHLRYCAQEGQSVHYAGRERSPAPACGHFNTHQAEQGKLVEDALVGELNGDSPAD
ncbi:MAG: 2-oxoglutarate dehydrogenase E1 component [Xanthomonadales bacterium]|nr:2-oxoglutarate dehydrogenase E1 component [Xanthomonadales bacterium]